MSKKIVLSSIFDDQKLARNQERRETDILGLMETISYHAFFREKFSFFSY